VEEEPLYFTAAQNAYYLKYSGAKRILLKIISNQYNHGLNQAQLVLKLLLNNTNIGCVAGSESHAYRPNALPTSKESK